MAKTRQIGRVIALKPKPNSSTSSQRRRLHASPTVRMRVTCATVPKISPLDRSLTNEVLDDEFDELGCELPTLLRIATQL